MLEQGLADLARGRPVLLYDMDDREQETDMVMTGRLISPDRIATLRREAGGLICVAIPSMVASKLGLPYLHDVFQSCGSPTLKALSTSQVPYGGFPAFSVTLNHRDTYTGITDADRSKTILELSNLVGNVVRDPSCSWAKILQNTFRSPGHVHVLIESDLSARQGQTELSVRLAQLAGLDPAMVICEMLDSNTHKALSKDDAVRYARTHGLAFIEGHEILEVFGVGQ